MKLAYSRRKERTLLKPKGPVEQTKRLKKIKKCNSLARTNFPSPQKVKKCPTCCRRGSIRTFAARWDGEDATGSRSHDEAGARPENQGTLTIKLTTSEPFHNTDHYDKIPKSWPNSPPQAQGKATYFWKEWLGKV